MCLLGQTIWGLHVAAVTFGCIPLHHIAEPGTDAPINCCKSLASLSGFPYAVSGDMTISLELLLDNGSLMRHQWLVEQALKEQPVLLQVLEHLALRDVDLLLE